MQKLILALLLVLAIASPVMAGTPVNLVDANGNPISGSNPLSVSGATGTSGATNAATTALASNLVVKASPGTLYSFSVAADSTLSAATYWVMIFDATSLPADGPVTPKFCFQIPSGTTGSVGGTFASNGSAFASGIVIGVSTTGCLTKTASVHAAFISGQFL